MMPRFTPRRVAIGRTRGYTVIELVMAIGIFAVGVTGVTAMEHVTAGANRHSKALATATALAQSWQEQLAIDALSWTQVQPISATTWLDTATASGTVGTWHLPAGVTGFGPGADPLGGHVDIAVAPEDAVFCTHIRITPLIEDAGVTAGSGLLRSEVRVFWPKSGDAWSDGDPYCDAGADPDDIGAATGEFHFVYKTTAIRQTTGL